MKIDEIKTPRELHKYMIDNFNYGITINNQVIDSSNEDFNELALSNWHLLTPEELEKTKYGICYDYVEYERKWFKIHGFEVVTIYTCFALGYTNPYPTHTFLAYKQDGLWYHFEVADYVNRGILEFNTLEDLVSDQMNDQIRETKEQFNMTDEEQNSIKSFIYDEPVSGLSFLEFIENVTGTEDII